MYIYYVELDDVPKVQPRLNNRRRTNAKQGDITIAKEVHENFGVHGKVPAKSKASKVYKAEWPGTAIDANFHALNGNIVDFKASFSKPLEQLIYPSLQIVKGENYSFEMLKNQKNNLHGHTAELDVIARFDAHFPIHKSSEIVEVIKEGPPARLYDIKDRSNHVQSVAWSVECRPAPVSKHDSMEDELLEAAKRGENYLRNNLRKSYEDLKIQHEIDEKKKRIDEMLSKPVQAALSNANNNGHIMFGNNSKGKKINVMQVNQEYTPEQLVSLKIY